MPVPKEISDLRNRFGFSEIECAALIHGHPDDWKAYEDGRKSMHPAFWELFRLKTGHSLPTSFDINEAVKVSMTTPDGRQWMKMRRVDKWPHTGANAWPEKYASVNNETDSQHLYLYTRNKAKVHGSRRRWAYPWLVMNVGDIALFQIHSKPEVKTIANSLWSSDCGAEFDNSIADIPGRGTFVVYERIS